MLTGLLHDNSKILSRRSTCDGLQRHGVSAYWLGPIFWGAVSYRFVYPYEITLQVELDKLGSVTQVAAFAEVAK